MVTVFLVDDHEIVRRGLTELIDSDPDLEVVGEAGDCSHALARIPALTPDVAVLDVRLPDGDGIELCREILSRTERTRCLNPHLVHRGPGGAGRDPRRSEWVRGQRTSPGWS